MQYGKYYANFVIFYDLFHQRLGEWNNSKKWETSEIFLNIAQGYCTIPYKDFKYCTRLLHDTVQRL